jgi:hypothetical protein
MPEMPPQVVPLQPLPEILQTTTGLAPPVTLALNCTCPPGFTCAELGVTLIVVAALRLTVAVPDWLGAATDVALTVTVGGLGGVLGAV